MIRFLALVLCLISSAVSAATPEGVMAPRVALVIGNGNYPGIGRDLPNPPEDAELMAKRLREVGFTVTQLTDQGRDGLFEAVDQFAQSIPTGATALVFYAGHGMQIAGANYLIPSDVVANSEQAVPVRGYPVKLLLEKLSATESAVNIVILDACRNNPFQPANAPKYRNYEMLGLAPVQAPRGTVVAYSTSPGQLAADGKGKNSAYTRALADTLVKPGVPVEQVLKRVGDEVRQRTFDDQIPWFESSLTQEYFFVPPDRVTLVAGKSPSASKSAKLAAGKMRGDTASTATAKATWFAGYGKDDWQTLDWELQQRAKKATADDIPALEHQASGGSLVAMTVLGLLHQLGPNVVNDPNGKPMARTGASNTKARQWFAQAAKAGFPPAQTLLGEMHYEARGGERDLDQAQKWLEAAAQAGYPRANLNLYQLRIERGANEGAGSALIDLLRP